MRERLTKPLAMNSIRTTTPASEMHAARPDSGWANALAFALSIALLNSGCALFPGRLGPEPTSEPGLARGVVYLDSNRNRIQDAGERGISGVRVSNGRDIVMTDRRGRYALPVEGDAILFVVKPRGMAPPVDERQLPNFYYIHKPDGSPEHLRYPGVGPTGPLPDSIDFPLHRQKESDRFRVILLGDPQPRNQKELDFFSRDIVPELPGWNASFGVSLGDLVGDDLALLDPLSRVLSLVGIPWYNVLGNHDLNFDAADDVTSDETFERHFGPTNYAFIHSRVHFIVLDDVFFHPHSEAEGRAPSYDGWLLPSQLQFVSNYIDTVPDDERVVVLLHIPLVGRGGHQVPQRSALFEILARHPMSFSVAGHTHIQAHVKLGPEAGNPGPPHHHWIIGTSSGSWWKGDLDELGVPHATMRDGSPNGYSILSFDGTDYSMRFKAARRPADYQMNIYAPDRIQAGSSDEEWVRVNVFAGSFESRIAMRLVSAASSETSDWIPLEPAREVDPAYAELLRREAARAPDSKLPRLPGGAISSHLWRGRLPDDLAVGSYWIEVQSLDRFGNEDRALRVLRVQSGR